MAKIDVDSFPVWSEPVISRYSKITIGDIKNEAIKYGVDLKTVAFIVWLLLVSKGVRNNDLDKLMKLIAGD
jgi:hypothetical protein